MLQDYGLGVRVSLIDEVDDLPPIGSRLELIGLVEVGDVVLEKSRWTTRGPGEDGKTEESTGLSTVVLRRQPDGCWRMIIDDPGLA